MSEGSSYRTILRSSSIMGAASVVNILSSIVKMKAAAVLLGPAGVGLVGLYQNLVQTGERVSALGIGSAGTRQVAQANGTGDAEAVGQVRRALFWGTLVLSFVGAFVFVALSGWIADHVLGQPERRVEVAWLALAVGLSVAAASQGALLTGLRRIGDVALIQVLSGVLASALGIAAIWWWGREGLLALVLLAPLVTFVVGHWFVVRLGRPAGGPAGLRAMSAEWGALAKLGVAFMVTGLVTTAGHLAVRTIVQRELGIEALGQFQAAWAIGMAYLGVVLGAMGTEYYPRLTAVIADHAVARRMVNEQTEVALILCGPILLALLAFAPWVIQLLYSAEFAPAVEVLRWQLLGDILKVMSWPLAFVILAAGAGKNFMMVETTGILAFVAGTAMLVPLVGLSGTGVAFLAMYVVYLALVFWLARRRIGFVWSTAVLRQAAALVCAAVAVAALARLSDGWAAVFGAVLAAGFALVGLTHLTYMADLGGPVGRLAATIRRLQGLLPWATP